MVKQTKSTVFKAQLPRAETPMDKTTRIVMEMIGDEAEQRNAKIARLRKARLEREAFTPAKPVTPTKKTGASKAAKK